jgi:hypothetical protein
MAVALPPLTPSAFRMTAAKYQVKSAAWRKMIEYPRLLSSVASGTQLQLQYRNIRDEDGALFALAWRDSLNGALSLVLPTELLAGISDTNLQDRIFQAKGLTPVFQRSQGFKLEGVIPGYCTVTCSLVFELRGKGIELLYFVTHTGDFLDLGNGDLLRL